jgi:arylsulfatase A
VKAYVHKIGDTPPALIQRMPSDDSHIKKRAERAAAKGK